MNPCFGRKSDSFYIYQIEISSPMKRNQKTPGRNQLLTANNSTLGFIHGMIDKRTISVYIIPHVMDINQKGEYINELCNMLRKTNTKNKYNGKIEKFNRV